MLNHIGPVRPVGHRAVAKLLACSMLTAASLLSFAPAARAQVATVVPVRESIDANGVDLFLGTMNADGPVLSAGQGDAGLSWYKLVRGNQIWGDNLVATLSVSGSTVNVVYAGKADRFTISGSSYIPTEANGSTLSLSGNVYTYVLSDGTVIRFNRAYVGAAMFQSITGVVTDVTKPSGEKLTYTFESMYYCSQSKEGADGQICTGHSYAYRVSSVQSNSGYKLTYDNAAPSTDPTDIFGTDWAAWGTTFGVSLTNTAVPGATSRYMATSFNAVVPYLYLTVTDPIGRATTYRQDNTGLVGIKRPGSSTEDVQIAYSGGRVSAITTAAGTTSYSSYDSAGFRYVTVTPPDAGATNYTFDIASQRMTSRTDPLSRTTSWQYDASGRVTRITQPEGNYTQLTYDSRGNVTEKRAVAKSGSGLADIVTPANYDASCTYAAKCNQPNWTKDAKGNQTDYTYNTSTGDLLTVAAPAASSGGTRPTTTYSYTTINGVQQVSSISACQSTASCAGTADEVKTSISYDINGLPNVVSKGAGDGSLTATTTIAYDDAGNVRTVDGPLPGSADTTRYRYDAARQLVGVVSADPDGAGALKPRAQRTTYDPKGRVTLSETGNVSSQSDGDWAGFTSLQQAATDYDGVDRPVKQTVSAGGTIYQVTQRSYDAAGTYDCTAVRMNSAAWGSLPGACTATTTGAAGPDRIVRNLYNSAREVTTIQTAYGTADQANEVASTYTNNGKLASVTDGEGNRTSYEYDGFDRLSKTSYPVTTAGSGTSSGSDYEQLGYDAASNVTSRRLRDGQVITYGYDNLNRVTSKVTPGSAPNWDVTYSYDLLGRVINATGDGSAVNALTYDALGRVTNEQNYNAGTLHAYDLAGRQTRITWSDGFHADYDYNVTGEVTAIRENGATSGAGVLATYAYDDLGRRTSVTRGNGTTTSYGYDAVSRLTSLTQDLAGSAYDFTNSFSYNPAGQIASLTRSNDAYAWNGHYNVDRGYGINGLNQATSAGPTSLGYDGRGNLTSSGSSGYGYTVENQLVSGPGVTMLYEPGGGQLLQSYNTATGADTRFAWSGGRMTAEINASGWAITRRYVPGPGVDETVVWYEGSGTSDRRWLHTDERGSVVAVTDGSGNVIGVNSYDEYGIPAAGNIGRFQYTGQAWMPELGMYYYKARIYSPTLGRFMQTDPTGYADGLNWYNYVGGDPVNFSDPTGLQRFCWTQAGYTTFYQDSDGNGHIEHVQSMQYCTDYESPGSVYPDRPTGGGSANTPRENKENKPCGATVTVNLFKTTPPILGHLGMSINGGPSYGFYGQESISCIVSCQGSIKVDTQPVAGSVTISITHRQAAALYRYLASAVRNPPAYNLTGNNCAGFCSAALASVGVKNPSTVFNKPNTVFDQLKKNEGSNNPRCE